MTTWNDAFSARTDHLLELVLTETSTDSAANTSVVTATLQVNPPSTSSSYNGYNDGAWTLVFDGTTYTGTWGYDYRTNRSTQVLKTVSKTITHAADGTKSVSGSGSANAGSGTLGSASITTKTLALTDFVNVPDAPAAPTLTRNSSGTPISITSAVASSSVSVTDYNYRYSTDGSTWSAAQAMGTGRTASLTATTTSGYYVQTRAYSSEGWGAWSSSSFKAGVPSAPGSISATRSGRDVAVTSGGSASDGGATITGYMVQRYDGTSWSSPSAMSGGSYVYTNLTPAKTYTFRVYATNSTGSSAYTTSGTIFVPAGGKRYDGSTFTPTSTVKRWDGAAWSDVLNAKRWDGAAWTDLS